MYNYRLDAGSDSDTSLRDISSHTVNLHILKCPFYHDLRIKYIKKYYYNRPSVWKLVQLLSVQNLKELYNLGKFLFVSCKRRSDII